MTRYSPNQSLYNSFKYGASVSDRQSVTWVFEVDWDSDGIYNGDNEAFYMRGLSVRRGREFYLNPSGQGFEDVKPGEMIATLDNQSGRFTPNNTSSPLYPYVKPGRRCKLWVFLNYSPYTVFYIFAGTISDIQPGGVDDRIVTITVTDDFLWLDNKSLTDTLKQDTRVAQAITDALTVAGWYAAGRTASISDNGDLIPWWWTSNRSALEAIQALSNAYMGKAFVDQQGVFTYYHRNTIYSTVISLDQSEILKDVPSPQPWEVVRNIIKVYAYPRSRASNKVLWELSTPLYLNPSGGQYTLFANYNYGGADCPATAVVSPVATTDYLANSNSDGSGTNLTADLVVSSTIYGTKIKLIVTNSGSVPAWVTFLQVRGDPLSAVSYMLATAEDTASQALYLPRDFVMDTPELQSFNQAVDFASFLKAWLAYPVEYPTIMLDTLPEKQFAVDLFDQIDLTMSSLGIDGLYLVSYLEHTWTEESGQAFTTKMILEPPLDATGYWTFSTKIGETSIFGF